LVALNKFSTLTTGRSWFTSDEVKIVRALKNISFELNDGDRLGVVGSNGSGKTTLLNALAEFIPSEERLVQPKNLFSTMMDSPDKSARRFAEITKEERVAEQAAIEAGLQDVFFGYDQWTLSDAGVEALNQDVAYLKEHPRAVLRIGGHCDERGTSDYNLVLGDKRAKAALSYLVDSGVKSKQVSVVSYGKERPFCSDHDEACYQQNRRGHMLLTTKN